MVRKERLELSQPKLQKPESCASTNSATSALNLYQYNKKKPESCVLFDNSQFCHFRIVYLTEFSSLEEMAGVPGFEPGNGGIKTRCLTAWRYSSNNSNLESR